MRLSLWQQFSSNHSGFFWVVGTFKTMDEARTAYEELRAMLQNIDRWHREHKQESEAAWRAGNSSPLPPEVEYAQKFNVNWPATIDWSSWGNYSLKDNPVYGNINPQKVAAELIDDAVKIAGRSVVVSNPDQTWMTTQPFEDILKHFGGRTLGYDLESSQSEGFDNFELHPRLSFIAPDHATADRIENGIKTYLSRPLASPDNPPPWNNDTANYEQVLGTSKLLRREYIDSLMRSWQNRFDLYNSPPASTSAKRMPAERLALRNDRVILVRDHLRFTLTDIWFYNQELAVSALIAYLEANGCDEIDFAYIGRLGDEGK
jgi:hypothetical protein